MAKSKVELIFEKWKAELANKDRSLPHVPENFDELFSTLHKSKVKFDDAYSILDPAIKAHQPSDSVAKGVYKRMKRDGVAFVGETEFVIDWKNQISDIGKQIFYSIYPIDGVSTSSDEEAKYGSMSAQEYRKQRRYIESMPQLDWTKIKHDFIDEDVDVDLGDL